LPSAQRVRWTAPTLLISAGFLSRGRPRKKSSLLGSSTCLMRVIRVTLIQVCGFALAAPTIDDRSRTERDLQSCEALRHTLESSVPVLNKNRTPQSESRITNGKATRT